jgi:hypothetical protein
LSISVACLPTRPSLLLSVDDYRYIVTMNTGR